MKPLPSATLSQHILGFAYSIRLMLRDLLMILRHRCKYERETPLNWRRRAWYTAKAIVCTFLVFLTPGGLFGFPGDTADPYKGELYDGFIVVAVTDSGEWFDGEYSGNWWYELRVGTGFRRNWWIYETDAST